MNEKTFKVPVTWRMRGVAYVEAESADDAVALVELGKLVDVMYEEMVDGYEADPVNVEVDE